MTRLILPFGWGYGSNTRDPMVTQALLDQLNPDWYHNWHFASWLGDGDEHFVPMSFSLHLTGTKLDPCRNRCVLFMNEPEVKGVEPDWSPQEAATRTFRQLNELWRAGFEFTWAAPNSNINGVNLDWIDLYARHLERQGISAPPYWAIHIYQPTNVSEWNYLVNRWWDWWGRYGKDRPVVVTETSAGDRADAAPLIMEKARELLDDERVLGVNWFSALPYHHDANGTDWPGLATVSDSGEVTLTELGELFVSLKPNQSEADD